MATSTSFTFNTVHSYNTFYNSFKARGMADDQIKTAYGNLCKCQSLLDTKKNTIVDYLSSLGFSFGQVGEESCTVLTPEGYVIGVITPFAELKISTSDFIRAFTDNGVIEADIYEALSDLQTAVLSLPK